MGELDPTTPWYEFLSYCECCWSLGVEPSVHRFMAYNAYYNAINSEKRNDEL